MIFFIGLAEFILHTDTNVQQDISLSLTYISLDKDYALIELPLYPDSVSWPRL